MVCCNTLFINSCFDIGYDARVSIFSEQLIIHDYDYTIQVITVTKDQRKGGPHKLTFKSPDILYKVHSITTPALPYGDNPTFNNGSLLLKPDMSQRTLATTYFTERQRFRCTQTLCKDSIVFIVEK